MPPDICNTETGPNLKPIRLKTRARTRSQTAHVGKTTLYRPPIIDEYYRLLAYVKWSVDKNLDFERIVFPMINSTLYTTYKRVRQKLYREWKNTYLNGWGKFNYLFDFGLRVLALNKDELAKINKFYLKIPLDVNQHSKDTNGEKGSNQQMGHLELPSTESNPKNMAAETYEEDVITVPQLRPESVPRCGVITPRPQAADIVRPAEFATSLPAGIVSPGSPFSQPLDGGDRDLKLKIFALENEIARLKHEKEGLLESCSNPSDAEVIYNLQRLVELGHQRSRQERGFNPDDPGMSSDVVSQRFYDLFGHIHNTCSPLASSGRLRIEADVEVCEVVDSWSRKTFKHELNAWLKTTGGESMTVENLLIGLVGAAVVDRAFQPAFPNILREKSAIASIYRDIIVQCYGPVDLRKADFHLFSFLIGNKKRQEELVEASAAELASGLAERLGPLWNDQHHSPRDQTQNRNDMIVADKPIEASKFKLLIKRALELKITLTASATRLRFMYFVPNDSFQEGYMTRCMGSDFDASRIKACLFPALFLAPPRVETVSSEEYVLEYNVDYNMYFAEFAGENPSLSALVAKAMVLT